MRPVFFLLLLTIPLLFACGERSERDVRIRMPLYNGRQWVYETEQIYDSETFRSNEFYTTRVTVDGLENLPNGTQAWALVLEDRFANNVTRVSELYVIEDFRGVYAVGYLGDDQGVLFKQSEPDAQAPGLETAPPAAAENAFAGRVFSSLREIGDLVHNRPATTAAGKTNAEIVLYEAPQPIWLYSYSRNERFETKMNIGGPARVEKRHEGAERTPTYLGSEWTAKLRLRVDFSFTGRYDPNITAYQWVNDEGLRFGNYDIINVYFFNPNTRRQEIGTYTENTRLVSERR